MKPEQIHEGAIYHAGSLKTRTVLKIGTYYECGGYEHASVPQRERWVCYRDDSSGNEGYLRRQEFARWAKGRADAPQKPDPDPICQSCKRPKSLHTPDDRTAGVCDNYWAPWLPKAPWREERITLDPTANVFTCWVLTYGGEYLSLRSYNKAVLYKNFLMATIYASAEHARFRLDREIIVGASFLDLDKVKIVRIEIEKLNIVEEEC